MTRDKFSLEYAKRSRWLGPAGMVAMLALITGCASSPTGTISLPSTSPAATKSEQRINNLVVESLEWNATKPDCKGECPSIELKSISFPDIPKLTKLIDHVLVYMTGVDPNMPRPYQTLAEYTPYFWKTAQVRDQTIFTAKLKEATNDLVVVELHTDQYLTGAAHGIPATQYLNWQRKSERVLALDEALLPNQGPAFTEALRRAHQTWLMQNEDAKLDPATYDRLWPFQESNNFALTQGGMVIKYDAYSIAPYSHGQPELIIPYSALQGILRPEFFLSTRTNS